MHRPAAAGIDLIESAHPRGDRPSLRGGDWPDCMLGEDFDCTSCVAVEPDRCDVRVDQSFLEFLRHRLYWERRTPRPGMERECYEILLGFGGSLSYQEVAKRVGEVRGRPITGVAVLQVLQDSRDLFLPLGQGRFRAISGRTVFHRDTDNLWYGLPPYDPDTPTRARRYAGRIAMGAFLRQLQPTAQSASSPKPRIVDVLRAIPGMNWGDWPSAKDLSVAREVLADDRLARAAVDFLGQQARRVPRPSVQEEIDIDLIERHARAAMHALVTDNLRLVVDRAFVYAGRGVEFVDLCQEGVFGLARAAEKYDPEKAAFSTYAVWWIRQAMTRYIADAGRAIRVPVHVWEQAPWLGRDHLRTPIPRDAAPTLRPIVSLEAIGERGHPAVEWIDQAEERSVAEPLREVLRELLFTLTPRERRVLQLRFGLEDGRCRTLEEVGHEFNVTRERIRQIQEKALRRLRQPMRLRRLRRARGW